MIKRFFLAALLCLGLTTSAYAQNIQTPGGGVQLSPPANRVVCLAGDSRHKQALDVVNPGTNPDRLFYYRSWPFWANLLSNGAVVFPLESDYAISGYTSYQTATAGTQVNQILADSCAQVAIYLGHNDRLASFTLDDATSTSVPNATATLPNIRYLVNTFTAAGKRVILFTDNPSGDTAFPAARIAGTQLQYRYGQRAQYQTEFNRLNQKLVRVVDTVSLTQDNGAAATQGDIKASMVQDGVHLSSLGAYTVAQSYLQIINEWGYAPRTIPVHAAPDTYSATNNPRGNLLTRNPYLVGYGLALGGAPTPGGGQTWPNGLPSPLTATASGTCTCTVTTALVTGTATGDWLSINVVGTASAGTPALYIDYAFNGTELATFVATDPYVSFGEYQINSGATGLLNFGQELTFFYNAGANFENTRLGAADSSTLDLAPIVASSTLTGKWDGAGMMNLHGGLVPTSGYVRHRIQFVPSASVNFTIYLRNIAVRKWSTALEYAQ